MDIEMYSVLHAFTIYPQPGLWIKSLKPIQLSILRHEIVSKAWQNKIAIFNIH